MRQPRPHDVRQRINNERMYLDSEFWQKKKKRKTKMRLNRVECKTQRLQSRSRGSDWDNMQ